MNAESITIELALLNKSQRKTLRRFAAGLRAGRDFIRVSLVRRDNDWARKVYFVRDGQPVRVVLGPRGRVISKSEG